MKITALDSFAHGRIQYVKGDPVEVSKGEAEDLRKAGLVTVGTDDGPKTATDSQDDLDDLVGGEKMDEAPKNKMAPAPANKGKK